MSDAEPALGRFGPVGDYTGITAATLVLTARIPKDKQPGYRSSLDLTGKGPGRVTVVDGELQWVDDPTVGPADAARPFLPTGDYTKVATQPQVYLRAMCAGSATRQELELTPLRQAFVANVDGRLTNRLPTDATVTVDGIEVVQAVQNPDNAVALVPGKQTIVRLYLTLPPSWVRAEPQGTVLGRLSVTSSGRRSTVECEGAMSLASRAEPAHGDQRNDVLASLNFRLPPGLLQGELTEVGLEQCLVRAPSGAATYLRIANNRRTTLTFEPTAPTLRLRILGFRYEGEDPATLPAAYKFDHVASWLRRAYPVGRVELTWDVVDARGMLNLPLTRQVDKAICHVAAIRNLDMGHGSIDRRTRYYAVVHSTKSPDNYLIGKAQDIPDGADPTVVAAGPTGDPSVDAYTTWDTDSTFGDWYTGHELGHTFGRRHVDSGKNEAAPDDDYPFDGGLIGGETRAGVTTTENAEFVGLDVGDPALKLPVRVLPHAATHDVMSYGTDQWVSPYTYRALHERLLAEETSTDLVASYTTGPLVNVVAVKDAIGPADGYGSTYSILYVNPVPGGFVQVSTPPTAESAGSAPAAAATDIPAGAASDPLRIRIVYRTPPKDAVPAKPSTRTAPATPAAPAVPESFRTVTHFVRRRGPDHEFVDVNLPISRTGEEQVSEIAVWDADPTDAQDTKESEPTSRGSRTIGPAPQRFDITGVTRARRRLDKIVGKVDVVRDDAEVTVLTWSSAGPSVTYAVQVGHNKRDWTTVAVGLTDTTFEIVQRWHWVNTWVRVVATNGVDAVISMPCSADREFSRPAPVSPVAVPTRA